MKNVITTRLPEKDTLTLKRESLVPRSLYDILYRRSGEKGPVTHLNLGEFAAGHGLHCFNNGGYDWAGR